MDPQSRPPGVRLWPAIGLVALAAVAILFVRLQGDWPFQRRNLTTYSIVILMALGLLIWWLFGSRVRRRARALGFLVALILLAAVGSFVRLKGVTGDFVLIFEPRWRTAPSAAATSAASPAVTSTPAATAEDYPQFLGPNRDGILTRPKLRADWSATPPQTLWRQPIGDGWSGFALVGSRAITQEQRGPEEWVSAYDIHNGELLWAHTNWARYDTTIAGIGPRATPTVMSDRVYALGATGILDCLDLDTGRRWWTRQLTDDAACSVPEWGFAGSPLVNSGRVIVQAGGAEGKSLLAYRADSGEPLWSGGSAA